MPRSVTAFYAAAVCFAAAICMTLATGVALFSIVRIAAPQVTASRYQGQLQGPPTFAAAVPVDPAGMPAPSAALVRPAPATPEQLQRARQQAMQAALHYERSNGLRSLILWGITLGVSGLLWLLHWRMLRPERGSA